MLLEPIHGVVVSDGYADYLDIALTHNRADLSHCVVVTSPKDKDSQKVAGKHNCILIVTDDGRKDGGEFNKGLLIERGLQQLPSSGWRVHFDADIVFPGNFRQRLGAVGLDKQCLYGVDRMNVVGEGAWQKVLDSGWTHAGFQYHHFLTNTIDRADLGSRIVYGEHGWIPIGFFQLWHAEAEYTGIYRTRTYATGSSSAVHDDVQFGLRWDRKHRVLIPEFLVAHLVTEESKYGANWKGRKTRRFGSAFKPVATCEGYP
jgi:hypothetical protein